MRVTNESSRAERGCRTGRRVAGLLLGAACALLLLPAMTVTPPRAAADPGSAGGAAGDEGEAQYQRHCAVCHGKTGAGDGPAAFLLRPRPRNFRLAIHRLVSTENGVASKQDLLRVIEEGMPGTGMPSWAHLPPAQRDAIADHLITLGKQGVRASMLAYYEEEEEEVDEEELAEVLAFKTNPGKPIAIAKEPAITVEGVARGRLLFVSQCAKCHGQDGRGMAEPEWRSAEGFPMWSRDLLSGIFKGGRDGESLYRRIWGGIPGTPMPAHKHLPAEDIWAISHYVQSLSNPITQELVRIKQERHSAARVAKLPSGPTDPVWRDVAPTRVALMPLFWRDEFRDAVLVRAVHDGKRVAVHLQWEDATKDTGGLRQKEFPDGAAAQFSDAPEAPLFTMGDPKHRVNIWHWKAIWSEDLKEFGNVGTVWPRAVTDGYYGREKGWKSDGMDDGLFRPAAERNNPLALAKRKTPVEDANAARFGSLTTQPPEDQNVDGKAEWVEGVWNMQFERDLASTSERDVGFVPGEKLFCAFAIWNGSIGDRNGQKSISIWNVLELGK